MLNLYENIKLERIQKGWTQSELAKKMGYSDKSMIAKIENGKVDLPQTKIALFAQIFGTTPAHLMGWDNIEVEVPDVVPGTAEIIDLYARATPEQRLAVLNLLRSFVSD